MVDSKSIHAIAYFNLLKTGSWIDERLKEALRPFSLTHAQLNVLYTLNELDPEPASANMLKESILVSNPDVTRLLDRLVKKGLVQRDTCPVNRRKIDIRLTDSGRILFEKAHASAKAALGDFFEKQITGVEAAELRRILHKIRE